MQLPKFDGPLDLLLSLIQDHKLDIFDIPISFVTDRYLDYMERARELNIDLAAEYLLMAATLTRTLKSRMLLPRDEIARTRPTRRSAPTRARNWCGGCSNTRKYKDAAQMMSRLPRLGRDTFVRRAREELPLFPDEVTWMKSPELSVYRLIELFAKLLAERKIEIPHEVFVERLSIGDRISTITDRLRIDPRISFSSLFSDLERDGSRHRRRADLSCRAGDGQSCEIDPRAPGPIRSARSICRAPTP